MASRRRRRRPPALAVLSSFSDSDVVTPLVKNRRRSNPVVPVSNSAVRQYTTKAAEQIRRRRARELAANRRQSQKASKAAKSSSLAYVAMKSWTVAKAVVVLGLLLRVAARNPYVARMLRFAWRQGKLRFTNKDERPPPGAVAEVAGVLGTPFRSPVRILISAGVLGIAYLIVSAAVRRVREILVRRRPDFRCGVKIATQTMTRDEDGDPPALFVTAYGFLAMDVFKQTFADAELKAELQRLVRQKNQKNRKRSSARAKQARNGAAAGGEEKEAKVQEGDQAEESPAKPNRFVSLYIGRSRDFDIILQINSDDQKQQPVDITVTTSVGKTYQATVFNIIEKFSSLLTLRVIKATGILNGVRADNDTYLKAIGAATQALQQGVEEVPKTMRDNGLGFTVRAVRLLDARQQS